MSTSETIQTLGELDAVIATRHRVGPLVETLRSLSQQSMVPFTIYVIDSSDDFATRDALAPIEEKLNLKWKRATTVGAASQREEGLAEVQRPYIIFLDDDIRFDPECIARLWQAVIDDPKLGGVSAMVKNQRYITPGKISRAVFTLLDGAQAETFAGRVLGPVVNLLPEDGDGLPEVVPTEWLNTTCTIYRRASLPDPVFDHYFTGYSLMEDVALSIRVREAGWNLANARTARIFHDSQSGSHKDDLIVLAKMELLNRHYVMTKILGRTRFVDYARLILWEAFQFCVSVTTAEGRGHIPAYLCGKWQAVRDLFRTAYMN